jgi:cell division protease FtsH
MSPKKRKLLAHHEAAHAVVARALGVEVLCITMFDVDGESAADTQTMSASYQARDRDSDEFIRSLETDAKVSLAGPIANVIHANDPKSKSNGTETDWRKAQDAVLSITLLKAGYDRSQLYPNFPEIDAATLQQTNALLKQFADETESLVRDLWPTIEWVAQVLIQKEWIDGAELDRLIADSKARQRTAS